MKPDTQTLRIDKVMGLILLYCFGLTLGAADIQVIPKAGDSFFTDPTPTTPVGDNNGATLGQLRLNAVQYAADIWGAQIHSDITILVEVSAADLSCADTEAGLAIAYPTDVSRNWGTEPLANIWFPVALANAFAEVDQVPERADITLVLNSNVAGTDCQSGNNWYWGLDGNAGAQIDVVTVALHFIAHGLGFATRTNLTNGSLVPLAGTPDIFAVYLEDHSVGDTWPNLGNAGRLISSVDTGDLHWTGAGVVAAAGSHVAMHAPATLDTSPDPIEVGASVEHFATSVTGELLRPGYNGVNHNVGLALDLLLDLGWERRRNADLSLTTIASDPLPQTGDQVTFTITLTNEGPGGALNIVVDNQFPADLSYVSHNGPGTYNSVTGSWTLPTLAKSTNESLEVTFDVLNSGSLTYVGEIASTSQGDDDSIPGNGVTTEDDYVALNLSGIGTILNDQLVNNLRGDLDQWRYYQLDVPAGQRLLNVSLFGGRGDMDLYLRHGSLPSKEDYDHRPRVDGSHETVNVDFPDAGTWYIGVFGYLAFSEGNLHANFTASSLYTNIQRIEMADCPTIRIIAEVGEDVGPVTGLLRGNFTVSESGDTPTPPTSAAESEPGIYTLTYTTPQLHGGDVYPRIGVTANMDTVHDYGVFTNCTPDGGAIDVWIDEHETYPGATVIVPIHVQPIEVGYHVNSFEIDISYDKDWFVFDEHVIDGALSEDWDLVFSNGNEEGKIYIAAADTNNLDLTADTDDIIVGLKFRVNSDTPVDCYPVVIDRMVFNNGTPLANLEDGALCIPGGPGVLMADLELEKTGSPLSGVVGGEITFTIPIKNNGPATATGVTVLEPLPDILEYVSHEGGDYDPETGIWDVGTLFVGDTQELTIVARGIAAGCPENVAEIRSSDVYDPDSTPLNENPDEDDIGILGFCYVAVADADLSLTKTVDNDTPREGDEVVFTLTATNAGPNDTLGDVVVTDRFTELQPAILQYVSHDGVGAFDEATGEWTLGPLTAGQSEVLTLTMRLIGVDQVTNVAEITNYGLATDPDSMPDNRDAAEDDQSDILLTPRFADLSVDKSVDVSEPKVGDDITFTLAVTNEGTADAGDVAVTDQLPPGLDYVSHSGDGTYDSGTGIWAVGGLTSGQTKSLDITVTVSGTEPMINKCEITNSDQGDPDSDTGNDKAAEDDQDEVVITPQLADLEVSLSTDLLIPDIGDEVTLTVTVDNQGPDPTSVMDLVVTIPAGLSFVSNGPTVNPADEGRGVMSDDYNEGTGVWTIGVLPVGETRTLEIVVQKDTSGVKEIIAQVQTSDQYDPDSVPNNNNPDEDDQANVILGSADLVLTSGVSEDEPDLGTLIDLTFDLHNAGPDPGQDIVVLLGIPFDLIYVNHSGGTYDPETRLWTIDALALASTTTLTVTVRVYGASEKAVVAEVMASGLLDPNSTPGNGVTTENDFTELLVRPTCSAAARIVLVNADPTGVGFNDPTPVSPVGGNAGTTLGEQRMIAFEQAAFLWSQSLKSNVEIKVEARWEALNCSATQGVLATAGPKSVVQNFPGAPLRDTWYPVALGNGLAGVDLEVDSVDVVARFNVNIDSPTTCFTNHDFYYGLDGNPGTDFDFITVAMHEMAHGLGFLTFVDGESGQRFMGQDDAFMVHLEDHGTGKTYAAMSDEERVEAATALTDLHWTGQDAVAAGAALTDGVDGTGHIEMNAPLNYQPGSSVSHLSTDAAPNQLLEPAYLEPIHDPGMALNILYDMGWSCRSVDFPLVDLRLDMRGSDPAPIVGDVITFTLTIRNEGDYTAGGIQVTNQLPAGLSYQSHASATADDYTPGSGLWDLGVMDPGDVHILTIDALVVDAVFITNEAEISHTIQPDVDSIPGNGDNTEDDYAVVYVTPNASPKADLSLTMTVDNPAPTIGDDVTYTLTLRNRGPEIAQNVEVTDLLAPGLSFLSASGGTYVGGVWQAGDVTVGATESLNIKVNVTGEGQILNTAEVTASSLPDTDSTPANGADNEDDYAEVAIYVQPAFTPCDGCAQVIINNLDEPGEGFNNLTPVDPLPGNLGTTLGEQRMIAFAYAAEQFCRYLQSPTPIVINARFDAMFCEAQSGILGTAAPASVIRDFDGAPLAATWYPAALANALSGTDLNGGEAEIDAVFNSLLDKNDSDDQPQETRAADFDCLDTTMNYVVENRTNKVKFEGAAVGLGEDKTWMRDLFVIDVANAGPSVSVSIKAARSSFTHTLVGVGDTVMMQHGFRVTLVSIVDTIYTFKIVAVCNRHALSHVAFDFGDGADVQTPTNNYTASRLSCDDLWNNACEEVDPEDPGDGGGGDGGGGDGGGGDGGGGDGGGDGGGGGGLPGEEPCVGDVGWYYGLDANPGNQFDFVTVVLHELLHGMGFSTQVDLNPASNTRGQAFLGYDDIFMTFLKDGSNALHWDEMSAEERMTSAADVEDLYWSGPIVNEFSGLLDRGINTQGEPRMNATNPVQSGTTASHFSPSLSPDRLMEPGYQGANHDPTLAIFVLEDIGWRRFGCVDLRLDATVDNNTPGNGDTITYTVTVVNDGPEDGSDVVVKLYLGGGLSYVSDTGGGAYDVGTGLWTIGAMALGSATSLDVSVSVSSGDKVFRAEVHEANEADGDSIPGNLNPFEDDYDWVDVGSVDLSLHLETNISEPALGGYVQVNMTVHNNGPDQATGTQVTLQLPAELTYVSDFSGGTFDPATGVWDLDSVTMGAGESLTIVARADTLGSHAMQAEITAIDQTDNDSTPGNGNQLEDDFDSTSVTVTNPGENIEVLIIGVYPFGCPVMKVKVRITQGGDPLTGLTSDMFTLSENNVDVAFAFEEDAEAGIYWFTYTSLAPDGQLHNVDITLTNPLRGVDPILVWRYKPFTNCNTAGCTEVFNNVVVPYVSGFQDTWRCFWFYVPPNQAGASFDSFLGFGDVDLYVKYGSEPTLDDYDWGPRETGNNEHILVPFPRSGMYYIGLHGFNDYTETNLLARYWAAELGMTIDAIFTEHCPEVTTRVTITRDDQPVDWLTLDDFTIDEDGLRVAILDAVQTDTPGTYELTFVTLQPDGGEHELLITANVLGDLVFATDKYSNCLGACIELVNNVVRNELAGRQGSFQCFYIDVPPGFDVLEFKTWDGLGDADLYVRFGEQPTIDTYDYLSSTSGNAEWQYIQNPGSGRWYCAVRGFMEYTDLNLLARYYNLDVQVDIEEIDLSNCPQIDIIARVYSQDGPLTGLKAEHFRVGENDRDMIQPAGVAELEDGLYKISYTTLIADGSEVFVNLEVTYNASIAFDDTSYSQCTRSGPLVDVLINKENTAPPGNIIDIPVLFKVEGKQSISQMSMAVTYDADLLDYLSTVDEGTMIEDWPFVDDEGTIPGQILLTASTLTPTEIGDEGLLVYLRFEVSPTATPGQCTELLLSPEVTSFNNGEVAARLLDGCFCVGEPGCDRARGDVDIDGDAAEAWDSLQILREITSIPTVYDPIPMCVKDTNCSGDVRLIDVVKVLQRTVRLIDGYCLDGPNSRAPGTFSIQITQSEINQGEPFELTIDLTDLPFGPVYGYSFDLDYDPTKVRFTGALTQENTMTSRWNQPLINDQEGRLSLSHINPLTPLEGRGTLVVLRGIAAGDAVDTLITFSRFELAEDSEPLMSVGPLALDVEGGPCYDVLRYESYIHNWPANNVLDILSERLCLGKKD